MWFSDGKKNLEERYSNGRLEGNRMVWHANGQVYLDENYKSGKMTGRCRKWDARGKLLSDEVLEEDSDDSPPDATPATSGDNGGAS